MSFSVLIVDDSRLARKFLKDSLPDDIDLSISEVGNGKEALEFCRNNQVDIMFLDLTMPEMDGFQLLKALQEDGFSTYIVVVSADIQPKARERILDLGANLFIGKPINTEKIKSVIRDRIPK
jgi:two-component system, chemotaxis family, chemotaxis protein CheY